MESLVSPCAEFWRGKRVLLTGQTGFKGSWLALWLHRLGAQVTGIALPPCTEPSLYQVARIGRLIDSRHGDIRDAATLKQLVQAAQPEIVFHLAAQALVRPSYADPLETFSTNVMGTANLLDALRSAPSARVAVMVTTDKVYRNNEWPYPYRENDALGGHDPYSASKAASELVVASYRDSFLEAQGLSVATARAGNVIGGGDWSVDRLLPDAVRAWRDDGELHIRRPQSVRPWQHVLEPLTGYLALARALWDTPALADAYNFGPETTEAASVRAVVDLAQAAYGRGRIRYAQQLEGPHEAGLLTLDTSKARTALRVGPRWSLTQAVGRSMDWYRRFDAGEDALALCHADIDEYEGRQ
ncbi:MULTISPECIES: CDP-glucose 4,6-dehydratase [Achromobacter]|uniref:CDP-glucose 4,6-dehydratase n=1 Tax=Achromobacter denitrificans TaxID=32002 RepID=A0A6N0JLN4_ACHDE|nr:MULTISPECIES: CDP-glucose 4,6-dehydratase [Achromobacter]MDF3857219.1 CDP-glucose 4,6-dehydratase [Achromobacter denitrificans]QKQ47977.1 CDP-glucose 4,6-dehydratase [Achromobacter denitrificans]